ncbi:MAG: sugar phosphate isomerase/epimerase [Anaerolineales bacterium]
MKLGFLSAIVPDLTLAEVLALAAAEGLDCVELACWPVGKAERRYAGVTHLDVANLTADDAARVNELCATSGVSISALGYYPNPLSPDEAEAQVAREHLRKVISAAALLGIHQVNTFIGRDWTRTVDANWPCFLEVWPPLVHFAEDHDVCIGIENCPMFFTNDEWPGGKNLAHSPAIWRRMFEAIPSKNLGLNLDPSHFVWQMMDYVSVVREFGDRIMHVHAKDARLDRDRLDQVGILANPNEYHTPKLPGLGDIDWGRFIAMLTETGYDGAVVIEVEDRAYEGSLERRKAAIRQSSRYLRQFIA